MGKQRALEWIRKHWDEPNWGFEEKKKKQEVTDYGGEDGNRNNKK